LGLVRCVSSFASPSVRSSGASRDAPYISGDVVPASTSFSVAFVSAAAPVLDAFQVLLPMAADLVVS